MQLFWFYLQHNKYKKAFQSNVNRPLSDRPCFVMNKFEHCWGKALYSEVQLEHVQGVTGAWALYNEVQVEQCLNMSRGAGAAKSLAEIQTFCSVLEPCPPPLQWWCTVLRGLPDPSRRSFRTQRRWRTWTCRCWIRSECCNALFRSLQSLRPLPPPRLNHLLSSISSTILFPQLTKKKSRTYGFVEPYMSRDIMVGCDYGALQLTMLVV